MIKKLVILLSGICLVTAVMGAGHVSTAQSEKILSDYKREVQRMRVTRVRAVRDRMTATPTRTPRALRATPTITETVTQTPTPLVR